MLGPVSAAAGSMFASTSGLFAAQSRRFAAERGIRGACFWDFAAVRGKYEARVGEVAAAERIGAAAISMPELQLRLAGAALSAGAGKIGEAEYDSQYDRRLGA